MKRDPRPHRVGYTVTAAVALAAAVLTSCTSASQRATYKVTGSAPSQTGTSGSSTSSTRSEVPAGQRIDTAVQARADLARLPVLARRPYVPGYQRSCSSGDACSFGPAWTDDQNSVDGHNGCGTRDDVLAAQLHDVELRAGSRCVVVAGTLDDPYTGAKISFSKARADLVPVDHVVPLALAWDLGAARWSQTQRDAFANDVALELLAVDEHSNNEKSDSGPGEWMPANRGYWCAYDQRFVTVLTRYRLEMTAADKAAMGRVLTRC